ncbi:MAG: molybdopterin molybdenumtransferase MoeA [Anaerolineales bacterium]|nr:molybdopterin molybdenumtransferase MoeA [Anaerolineales bacterium]
MPEFLKLHPPGEALDVYLGALSALHALPSERIKTDAALGRVLAADILAPIALPPFNRSTVDGYAVRAADTYGASASLPAYLKLIGEVHMGAAADITLLPQTAAVVHTGGMIPDGADAVVMLEDTDHAREGEIEIHKPAAVQENILLQGEDVQAGDSILIAGTRLRAQEIGGLMGLGLTSVDVVRRPRVGILSTGDEVIPPSQEPMPGQVRDINTFTLASLVSNAGGEPISYGIIADNYRQLKTAAEKAHAESDLVIITAGSSVSARDITANVIAELGQPGVLVHGIAIRPGKPTILALAEGVPIIGLPGNPVSALVIAGLFVVPVLRLMLGMAPRACTAYIEARMTVNIASLSGREDYQPVVLVRDGKQLLAQPIFGRSNLIFTLVRADGLVRIPPEATGIAAGELVRVTLLT